MKRYFFSIIVFSVVALFLQGVMGTRTISYATVDESQVEEKKERKKELEDEKTRYERELVEKQSEKKEIVADLLDTNRDLDWSRQKLDKKEKELSRKRAQRDVVNEQLKEAEGDLLNTQDLFEKRLRIYYKNGLHNPLNMFIDSRDLSDLVRRVRYTEGLLSYDKQTIETIIEQKALLAEMKVQLDQDVREEEALWRDIETEKTTYQRLANRKKALRDEISKDIRALERLLNEIEKEETEIEFFLEAAAKGNLSTNFDGSFSIPLKSYKVSSPYGMRTHPIFRKRKMHNGTDLDAKTGDPIMAAGAGRIIFAGWKTGYGNTVMIDHGKGYATLYGHMSAILVNTGQDVMEGQPIGKVGSTGVSTGDHLHFEIRVNGKPRNPASFVNF